MRFYVASKFEDQERVKIAINYFGLNFGWRVTKDWTLSGKPCLMESIEDINGVRDCDIFIGLFDKDVPYKGAIAELGMAIILGKIIFIKGNYLDPMIFMNLPNIHRFNELKEIPAFILDRNI